MFQFYTWNSTKSQVDRAWTGKFISLLRRAEQKGFLPLHEWPLIRKSWQKCLRNASDKASNKEASTKNWTRSTFAYEHCWPARSDTLTTSPSRDYDALCIKFGVGRAPSHCGLAEKALLAPSVKPEWSHIGFLSGVSSPTVSKACD